MFSKFFYELKAKGLDVSLSEWLTLHAALDKGLANSSLTEFYYLSRSILVRARRILINSIPPLWSILRMWKRTRKWEPR